jgi:uracil-DNA glycosylase family 4
MSLDALEEARKYLARRRDRGLGVGYRISTAGELARPCAGTPPPVHEAPLSHEGASQTDDTARLRPATGASGQQQQESRSPAQEAQARGRVQGKTASRPGGRKAAFQSGLFDADEKRDRPGVDAPDLASLADLVSGCTRCPLCHERTQTVFGSGSPGAKLVFVGEAPGREEDLQGLPFVGRAGKLLTKMLASVGMTRDEVYITNILKCRPPNNRDPSEEESRACEPYLERQIELIRPALICALGRVAGQKLLGRNASLSVLRQGLNYYGDVRVIVTYHPAALLRNPNLKRDAWEDFKMMRRLYDEALEEQDD